MWYSILPHSMGRGSLRNSTPEGNPHIKGACDETFFVIKNFEGNFILASLSIERYYPHPISVVCVCDGRGGGGLNVRAKAQEKRGMR